jgi:hypothetical protein
MRLRQVGDKETSASEPSLRCRKQSRRRQNWGLAAPQDKLKGYLLTA